MSRKEFIRIQVMGFRGSEHDSQVFEDTEDLDPNMALLKRRVKALVEKCIDKGAEEIGVYITEMKQLPGEKLKGR